MVGALSSRTGVAVGVRVGKFVDSVPLPALGVGNVSDAVGVSAPFSAIYVARPSAVAVIDSTDSAVSVGVSSNNGVVDSSSVGSELSAIASAVFSGVGVLSGAGLSVLFSAAVSTAAGAASDASASGVASIVGVSVVSVVSGNKVGEFAVCGLPKYLPIRGTSLGPPKTSNSNATKLAPARANEGDRRNRSTKRPQMPA